MELCEELLRKEVGIRCIQEVRWRGMGSQFLGSLGRRFKLWWSGDENKIGRVGLLVGEDLCMNVEKIIFGKKVVRIVWAYAPQRGRSISEKKNL